MLLSATFTFIRLHADASRFHMLLCAATYCAGWVSYVVFIQVHTLLARYIVIAWFSLQCQTMYSTNSFFNAVFWYIKQQQPVVASLNANVYVRPPHIGSRSVHATKGGNVTHSAAAASSALASRCIPCVPHFMYLREHTFHCWKTFIQTGRSWVAHSKVGWPSALLP